MVKNFLNKSSVLLLICLLALFWISPVRAESYSDLFIKISDAQTALDQGESQSALDLVEAIQTDFLTKANNHSKAGQKVQKALSDLLDQGSVTKEGLRDLSKKLLAFEEEQNPLDLEAEKTAFKRKVYPALERLSQMIETGDREAMKKEYLAYNGVWSRSESIVRRTSIPHYGAIETAMSLLRSSMEVEPLDIKSVQANLSDLETALDDFLTGKEVSQKAEVTTLGQGIKVLQDAHKAFVAGNAAKGQEKIKIFISSWPVFEGEVSTRNASLYNRVESKTPIIMVKGVEASYQEELQDIITELKSIDSSGNYNVMDAMLILLREGVEALLIVLALVGSLKASKQFKGLKWVYVGAGLGILTSFLAAWLLQQLFPAVSSGTNREIIEGIVGVFAVVMMLGVGIWLHSKSSAKAWRAYMDRQLAAAISTGGFVSMFTLSFLAVFREGAETILFYAGILPRISPRDFWLGVGLAVVSLIILAYLFTRFSNLIPINKVFLVLTCLIYLLAFKMLGTSIHQLQLTNLLPTSPIPGGPSSDLLGIYPNWQVLMSQLGFLVLLAGFQLYQAKKEA